MNNSLKSELNRPSFTILIGNARMQLHLAHCNIFADVLSFYLINYDIKLKIISVNIT
jgi:hypothetical protein